MVVKVGFLAGLRNTAVALLAVGQVATQLPTMPASSGLCQQTANTHRTQPTVILRGSAAQKAFGLHINGEKCFYVHIKGAASLASWVADFVKGTAQPAQAVAAAAPPGAQV